MNCFYDCILLLQCCLLYILDLFSRTSNPKWTQNTCYTDLVWDANDLYSSVKLIKIFFMIFKLLNTRLHGFFETKLCTALVKRLLGYVITTSWIGSHCLSKIIPIRGNLKNLNILLNAYGFNMTFPSLSDIVKVYFIFFKLLKG